MKIFIICFEYYINQLSILSLIICCSFCSCQKNIEKKEQKTNVINFQTNQEYLESLNNRKIDFSDTLAVIKLILSNLNDTSIVYPSEGYYYFTFSNEGTLYVGNLGFWEDAPSLVNFNISESNSINDETTESEDFEFQHSIGNNDGAIISKNNNFVQIQFENMSKVFKLHNEDENEFSRCVDEKLIGTCFDESGVKFFLIYNVTNKAFYYLLLDTHMVDLIKVNHNIYYDKRTLFAFYNDQICNRYILIGVSRINAESNNWFDGPFDQLPERNIIQADIDFDKMIMERRSTESVDKVGNYINNPKARVALCSYIEYTNLSQLLQITYNSIQSSETYNDFITKITTHQILN
ncbi:MAG: hypothetical protein WAT37_13060 [Saprospiraceae bacterium]